MRSRHATTGGLLLFVAALSAEDVPTTQTRLDELMRQSAELAARLDAVEQRQAQAPSAPPSPLRLIDLSLDIISTAGTSTANDALIPTLQGGGHDPKRRGFTFQNAELSLGGAVDPFFTAEMHLIAFRNEPDGTTSVELEEAYARSTSLPAGLELKVGQYLTEFGRFNPTHPHAWQFIDQPIILTRVFGGDGQRSPGARLLWSLPTAWLSEAIVGIQDANGETSPSYLSSPDVGAAGGRPFHARGTRSLGDMLVNARWVNALDVGDGIIKAGVSAAGASNAAGDDTRTTIWGADIAYRWHPAGGERGWPFVLIETEYIERAYQAGAVDLVDSTLGVVGQAGRETLRDRGWVAQIIWGFHPGWAAGLRGEYCTGSGSDIVTVDNGTGGTVTTVGGRGGDPLRDDRTRYAALLSWQPSEFAHFRLQYDQDHAARLERVEHSVWLGAEFLIGTHPAHVF
ncbi:MAG: hypothetical protein H0X38_08915 [Planctomycetes bacterium]|nr:hypothetical protein [Planctomycetota bacterium]